MNIRKKLPIKSKKTIATLIVVALIIPVAVFGVAVIFGSGNGNSTEPTPTPIQSGPTPTQKPPMPTFADAPRVEGELIIQYNEGMEFHNLSEERQSEIMSLLEENGVISQEKLYEATEGEQSRYYLLQFSEGVNIENAAQRIYELPEIEGAQPNSEVGLF